MNFLMKTAIVLSCLTSLTSFGSDHWDTCVSADGNMVLDNGSFSKPPKNSEENYVVEKVLHQKKLKTRHETCTLQRSKSKVVSLSEEVTYEIMLVRLGETTSKVDFICTRGGSGIPASDSCDEKTAKLTEKLH